MLNHDHIDILKMDFENFEWSVLEDLFTSKDIKKLNAIKQIILEIHFSGTKNDQFEHQIGNIQTQKELEILKGLSDFGYEIFHIFQKPNNSLSYEIGLKLKSSKNNDIINTGFNLEYFISPQSKNYYIFLENLKEITRQSLNVKNLKTCKKVQRFVDDGGWDLCMDSLKNDDPLVIYSFGINQDDSFDRSIVKKFTNSNVYMFDPTNGWATGNRPYSDRLHFYSIDIVGENQRDDTLNNKPINGVHHLQNKTWAEELIKISKTLPEIMRIDI